MKFLVDECLSPTFVAGLAERGYVDAIHPKYMGWLGIDDHLIVRRALAQDRTIVSANAVDFRALLREEILHPGLILLPNAQLELSWRLFSVALGFIEVHADPTDYMINQVIEISLDEGIRAYTWSANEA